MMVRLLLALAALIAAPVSAQEAADVRGARETFHFAFPVYELARTRHQSLTRLGPSGPPPINRLIHRRQLADHTSRNVTTPNNDTLYSHAWLDLAASPVLLELPDLPDRYHSVALMDVFGDNFSVLGTRATGGRAARFLVVGPRWEGKAPGDARLLRATSNDVWLLLRVLVDGPTDLPAAQTAQDGFKLTALRPGGGAPGPIATADPDAEQFLSVVNQVLGRSPLPPVHARRMKRFAMFGVRPGEPRAWAALAPGIQAIWRRNMASFRDSLRDGLQDVGRLHNGWSHPRRGVGEFRGDDLFRARVALGGLGALPADEAVYLSAAQDADGQPLNGKNRYRLRIPASVPVDGFWSLSLYEVAQDGRLFFTDNPIRRYAVGNRTKGLTQRADGQLELLIQHQRPADDRNWLPAPPGPFRLTFRAYLPRPEMRSGNFRLPAIIPLDKQRGR